jgi:transketolase
MIKKEMTEKAMLEDASLRMRLNILRLAYTVGRKGAHLGSSLSLVEILAVLYLGAMRDEDILILSKGHGSLCQYCAMREKGLIDAAALDRFEENGGPLPGQASMNKEYGLAFSSGSLGMGLLYATGIALASKNRSGNKRVYAVLGDGELNEGCVWEAVMFAAQYHLANLTIIIDRNHMQSDGATEDIIDIDPGSVFNGFGWDTISCDGHDIDELLAALKKADGAAAPVAIIARTVKGKGVPFMENNIGWHHNHLTTEQYEEAVEAVKGKNG